MFRRHPRHRKSSDDTQASLEQAQADRREQEDKTADELAVRGKLARIERDNDVARLLRYALGGNGR